MFRTLEGSEVWPFVKVAARALMVAFVVLLVFAGCNGTQIRDQAASAIVTLTDEERSLATETVRTITELVALRDSIYEELATIAGMTEDEVIHQALEEAAERMANGMTTRLQKLAARLQAHSKVLQVVIRQLHTIHQLALDQINIMAMLQAPLSFFGIPPFDAGGSGAPVGPTGPGPPTPSSPGLPWPEIILTTAAAYTAYKGGKKGWDHHKKKSKEKRLSAEREEARDQMFAALAHKIVPASATPDADDEKMAAFLKLMAKSNGGDDDPSMSTAGITLPRNGRT